MAASSLTHSSSFWPQRKKRGFVPALAIIASLSLLRGLVVAAEREATPAVVNPVLRSPLRQTVSLDGGWDFALDASGIGEQQQWFSPATELTNRLILQVPGCWEAQGVGGPGLSTTVTPERSIRPLRGTYVGRGWYRKSVRVPRSWAGRQIWLKIGGVHAQGWFWVNGTYIGSNNCYCGSYKYNITDLVQAGGNVVIAAEVRNDVPSRKGLMAWIERFGGLYRSVELEATPALFLDDVYIAGDFDDAAAVAHIRIRGLDSIKMKGQGTDLLVTMRGPDGTIAGRATLLFSLPGLGTTNLAVSVPLVPFHPWSPEEPNLYKAEVVLRVNGHPTDGWVERFGVRKWEVRGGNFFLNNHKYFIRGFGDDSIYPLTLVSPASREVHKAHLQLAHAYGFGYVRLHTHCELPEYFEAADEIGIMVQPELPYYGSTPSAGVSNYFKPREDLEELYTHYRRYVSLATYCTGNEGHLGSPIDREVYQLAKRLDPSRLTLHQDGGANHKDNSDFYQAPSQPWAPGTLDDSWPCDAHEYLNLATEEDPRLAEKYTGAIRPPVGFEDFDAKLKAAGLIRTLGLATLDAGNQLQRLYQKRGLEQARLDPACDGYIFWTIVDVGSPAAQGLFNQFWEPKVSQPQFFRQFNSPTAILAKFDPPERVLITGQSLDIEWWISNFSRETNGNQELVWSLVGKGDNFETGSLSGLRLQRGDVKGLSHSHLLAPALTIPAKLAVTARLPGTSVSNSWPVWVFPRRNSPPNWANRVGASPSIYSTLKERYPALIEMTSGMGTNIDLLVTERLDQTATQMLQSGKGVLLLQLPGPTPGVKLGWWSIGQQAGTAIFQHPAFGDFPQEGYLDELWFRLAGRTVKLSDAGMQTVEPLMVGRGSSGYLAHVFQARAGKGKLLASGLQLLSPAPESDYLLNQFIRYALSSEFQPRGSLDVAQLTGAWRQ